MAKIKTNIFELLFKQVLIGQKIYIDDNTLITIDDINYQPLIQEVYIKSGDNGYRMSVNSEYEFELLNNLENKIIPNKGRIIPKQE